MEQEMQMPEDMGRGTDTVMAHLSLGEVVIPRAFLDDPQVLEMLQALFAQNQADLAEFTVGDPANKINPETGYPEFFFKKLFKTALKLAPIAAAFIPGLQPLAAAGIGAASGLASGSGLKSALLGGLGSYAGAGGLGDTVVGRGISSLKSGIADSGIGRAIGGAFDSVGDTVLGRGVSDAYNGVMGSSSGATLPGIGKVDLGTGSGVRGFADSIRGAVTAPTSSGALASGSTGGGSSFLNTGANIFGGLNQDAAIKKQQKQLLGANQQQLTNLERFDPSGITSDPGYEFQRQQGEEGLNRQLAASGALGSGRAVKAATQYQQDYANNAFQSYYQRWLQKTQNQNALIGDAGNVRANATGAGANNLSQSLSNALGAPVGQYGGNMTLEELRKLGMAV